MAGGLSARRATTLLFAIENRTAQLVARTRQVVPIVLSEQGAQEREHAFLDALAGGRDLRIKPTIQDLERFASGWSELVPDDPGLRAGVARLLGSKYAFTYEQVPRLRATLGLTNPEVEQAFQRLFGASVATIYAPRTGLLQRLRFYGSAVSGRLDSLPAFWLAFVVTLIIGAVNLALPIAVAGIGALPGIALIVVLGLINVVTVAAMVEVVTRSGSIRYRNAFIGTVVADYLGSSASAILSIVLTCFSFGLLLIFYIGISTTLADATTLPAPAWMIVLFLVGLFFLTRGSLNATMASTIVITTVNVTLLLVISALAFTHFKPENLSYVNLPWTEGGSFSPLLLGALIGVVLDIYAAHILVAIFGRTLLQRDPGGRGVLRGHAAGIVFAMLLNVVWVLAVCGAVAPQVLSVEPSTALVPLAAEVGPVVRLLGAIFVVLSMGLGLIQFSLALFGLARERIGQRFAWAGSRGRFLVALIPVILVLLIAEWMVLTNTGSFAGILGFLGVMVHSLMSGIFPALLLVASRRKGELVPGVSYRVLGHPLVVGGVYLLFLANLFLHGLVIWQEPLQRLGGVVVGLLMVVVTAAIVRRGAFRPRVVVEVRQDQRRDEQSLLSITASGQPAAADVQLVTADGEQLLHTATVELPEFASLRSVGVDLLPGGPKELKLWAQTITPEGISEDLPVSVSVHDGDVSRDLDLLRAGGQQVLPLKQESSRLDISLPDART